MAPTGRSAQPWAKRTSSCSARPCSRWTRFGRQDNQPRDIYHHNENLRDVINLINSGHFSHGDDGLFRPLTDNLLDSDPFLVCADFQDYIDCQAQVSQAYQDKEQWSRMSILNVARCGRFSSDRAIREYNAEIWRVPPLSVKISEA